MTYILKQAEKALIQAQVSKFTIVKPEEGSKEMARSETMLIHDLIAQYLAHDGYVETARAFAEEVLEESRSLADGDESKIRYLNAEEDVDAVNRQSKSNTTLLYARQTSGSLR